jgi:hypothetical protein
MKNLAYVFALIPIAAGLSLSQQPQAPRNVVVYKETGRFAGWPANHGIWSWGNEIVLRDDGGCWDLGYPRTVQRADGKIVTVYYFNNAADQERYIGATIWDPGR